ncbi:MAG: hypothetical protein LBO69_01570 [Ignavibacteria bacterium]|jgi:hypothetical protein|nr:hypothetical protein [Ignavibacteria bacterium]
MSVSSIGGSSLSSAYQTANATTRQTASMSALKGAMAQPQEFLQLLEASISVKNATNIASGMGINVDSYA